MPLIKRAILPIQVSNKPLVNQNNDELPQVTNNTLSYVIIQLSSLCQHADDLFHELYKEADTVLQKVNSLNRRMKVLSVKVRRMDHQTEEVNLQDMVSRPAYREEYAIEQGVVSRDVIPHALQIVYNTCEPPPPLYKLDPHRDDGLECLRFYTDPSYFFQLWLQKMQADTEKAHAESKQKHRQAKGRDIPREKEVRHVPKSNYNYPSKGDLTQRRDVRTGTMSSLKSIESNGTAISAPLSVVTKPLHPSPNRQAPVVPQLSKSPTSNLPQTVAQDHRSHYVPDVSAGASHYFSREEIIRRDDAENSDIPAGMVQFPGQMGVPSVPKGLQIETNFSQNLSISTYPKDNQGTDSWVHGDPQFPPTPPPELSSPFLDISNSLPSPYPDFDIDMARMPSPPPMDSPLFFDSHIPDPPPANISSLSFESKPQASPVTVKIVPDQRESVVSKNDEARSEFLKAIETGVKLRKVQERQMKECRRERPRVLDVAFILDRELEARRKAIEGLQDEENSDLEDWK